jgi:hypothetical protein
VASDVRARLPSEEVQVHVTHFETLGVEYVPQELYDGNGSLCALITCDKHLQRHVAGPLLAGALSKAAHESCVPQLQYREEGFVFRELPREERVAAVVPMVTRTVIEQARDANLYVQVQACHELHTAEVLCVRVPTIAERPPSGRVQIDRVIVFVSTMPRL